MREAKRIFLTAEWRNLVMLNYEVQPALLAEYVPPGTTLDSFEGKTYVSLVGVCFSRTRLWGKIAVPLHTEFEELNLRFYVRRRGGSEKRRGVCFIAEIVPKRAIAWTARLVYGENYRRFPMEHRVAPNGLGKMAEYGWRVGGRGCRLFVHAGNEPGYPREGSLEQFISELVAQAVERVADRRLGKPQSRSGPRHATLLQEHIQDTQEIEVDAG